jgi:gluconolactonase
MTEPRLIATGLRFPEGPIALRDGSVLLVEVARGTLTRVEPDGRVSVVAELGGGPNGAAIGPDGAVYVANNGGVCEWREIDGHLYPGRTSAQHRGGSIQRYDQGSGMLDTLYDAYDGHRLLAPNDLVFDREGDFWFTDAGCSTSDGRRYGALYHARADGSKIVRARGGLVYANGVGLSPDERVLYVADTVLGRVWALDVESPGVLAKPASPFSPGRVIATLPGHRMCDSLAVEADGRVCVATMDFATLDSGITIVGVDGAIEYHRYPGVLATNICFGGADRQDAWVTCGASGQLFMTRWPRRGLPLHFER